MSASHPSRPIITVSCLLAVVGLVLLLAGALGAQPSGAVAHSIELSGTIDPASERWLGQALEHAGDQDARLAIVRLDTPGGLDSSMRSMVKDIVAAPMPVVVYVSPDGARAASAGLFVTQAADVAAMAPQTNIGSATRWFARRSTRRPPRAPGARRTSPSPRHSGQRTRIVTPGIWERPRSVPTMKLRQRSRTRPIARATAAGRARRHACWNAPPR